MQARAITATAMRAATVAALLAPLAGCAAGVLDPVGPVGHGERTILFNALAIMLAIVIPTMIATIAFAWWFRAGNTRARYRPDFVYSGQIELLVWSVPLLTILFLGGVIWTGSHELDPARPLTSRARPLEVQVVALDWKWLFIYPEQRIASVNRLVIPVGVPVHFTISSASVLNTFFVPRLGSQIYAMNGMRSQLNLQADKPGTYWGQSAHYSGDGFSDMNFRAFAVPVAQFGQWTAAAAGRGPVLDAATYRQFARQSQEVAPFTFRAVEPGLFDAVVARRLPPAPGPERGRGGTGVSPGDAG
ncbi:cytochrome bb3 quinol oxidase subunit 2 [Sphingomonas gellani]|uniref:Ubiquinol oxidase subunit 2 n=1 Tax=Sphingomonas gellani TaxID=1166340 RepID=A0A1H8DP30_9SPHN|nr:ubiquinol oxidase subunit II [Sphingomonas gellani]SEN08973.1 cytochrome bb3 quinol oxidase subunit 2 [Sphingomonas gellani]